MSEPHLPAGGAAALNRRRVARGALPQPAREGHSVGVENKACFHASVPRARTTPLLDSADWPPTLPDCELLASWFATVNLMNRFQCFNVRKVGGGRVSFHARFETADSGGVHGHDAAHDHGLPFLRAHARVGA